MTNRLPVVHSTAQAMTVAAGAHPDALATQLLVAGVGEAYRTEKGREGFRRDGGLLRPCGVGAPRNPSPQCAAPPASFALQRYNSAEIAKHSLHASLNRQLCSVQFSSPCIALLPPTTPKTGLRVRPLAGCPLTAQGVLGRSIAGVVGAGVVGLHISDVDDLAGGRGGGGGAGEGRVGSSGDRGGRLIRV